MGEAGFLIETGNMGAVGFGLRDIGGVTLDVTAVPGIALSTTGAVLKLAVTDGWALDGPTVLLFFFSNALDITEEAE